MNPYTVLLAILLAILAGVAAALLYEPWQRWLFRRAIKQYGRECGEMEREWEAEKGLLPKDLIDLARRYPFSLEEFSACNRVLIPFMKKPPAGIGLTIEEIKALLETLALDQCERGIMHFDLAALVRQIQNDAADVVIPPIKNNNTDAVIFGMEDDEEEDE